jgi:ribosomal protein L11 methyltransferase
VRAGRFLVHGSHDRDKVRSGDIAIEIDAGQAFGTGHHGTTAGCLEVIDRVVRSRRVRNALDLGTGSGVLAIAVRKLKNIPVLATDIDPIATRVAAENVRRNGIASGIVTETAPGFHSTAFSAWTVRPDHRQYSGAAADQDGAAARHPSGAGRIGDPVGHSGSAAVEGAGGL